MMGTRNGPYQEDFPIGSVVQIADQDAPEHFRDTWRLHHPLQVEQVAYAGRRATVRDVGFYHGADELYELDGVPGIWHERCLSAVEE